MHKSKHPDDRIEDKHRREMNTIAKALDDLFNPGLTGNDRNIGFVLMVFPFGDHAKGRFNYISNANRTDIVVLMKEMIARFEGQPEVEGRA